MTSDPHLACPESTELWAFADGELTDSRLEQLAKHIEHCESCGIILDSPSQHSQSGLVAELRAIKHRPAAFESRMKGNRCEALENLVEAACDAVGSSTMPASFDSGRRLANKLKEGPVRLGRFHLESELGVGAFGYVFKARDTQLDRIVAIKVQRAGIFATDEDAERFIREARSIARLNHPGIVTVYDTVRSEEDICNLVTQFIDGESLDARLQKVYFGFEQSATLIASICDALQYAHENGIVHRDVKPSNILLDASDQPHLMDFGLAKSVSDNRNTMTSEGRVMGTPAYMSPEQAAGRSTSVDARSDVFSIGVMLYEMLTGERPFQGNRRMLLLQVIEDEPRSPRQLKTNIPFDLETICLKALSKSQSRRYQSAREMAADLRRFTSGRPIKARPMGFGEKFWRWCHSYPLAASLIVAVPLASIGGFAYLSWLSTHFVHSTALESTRMEANMLEDINEYYSESVVGRLDQNQVPVTHQYATTPNSIPLPFTFMIDAGKKITEDESGMQVRIYSDYPWRENTRLQNEFESRAIQALGLGCRTEISKKNDAVAAAVIEVNIDGRSYHEFSEVNGEPVLRYARAQMMKQSCVHCHNNDAMSPKRDWVEGEVAGVLSITRPLHRDIALTRSGLRSAFNIIAFVATLLIGLTLLLFLGAKSRSMGKMGASFHGND